MTKRKRLQSNLIFETVIIGHSRDMWIYWETAQTEM